jgi:serine protease AprX
MKKIIYLFIFFPLFSFSQSTFEIEKIINTYDLTLIEKLKKDLNALNSAKEQRISNYLSSNITISKEFFSNGIKYKIHDIIDNKPLFVATFNKASAIAVRTNTLYPGGSLGLNLTGSGMNIGVWDGGWALVNHVEFMNGSTSRISTPDNPAVLPAADFHATHVIGTVGASGINANAKGMAFESNLKSFDWTNDENEVISEATNNGLLLSNHSYGIPIYGNNGTQNAPDWMMGCYNTDANNWDQIAFNSPYYLEVTSAGNSGTDSYPNGLAPGLDKLTGEKNAKNNLVVANANPTVHPITGVIQNLVINSSSSQGPSDDGRIKPDIAADGTNVISTSNDSTNSYDTATGTSMSSPSVAGTLLLLQQHYNNLHGNFMKSATIKGLVCHTALDDSNNVGPDPYFGWGLLDARASALAINNSIASSPTAVISENILTNGQTFTYEVVVSNPQLLKATLCWTDPAGGAKDGQLNSSTPALKHNLDLRIIKGDEINFPWKLDLSNLTGPAVKGDNNVDNVEKVEVENALGTYTVQVKHKGFLVGGSQNYSLIITGFDQTLANEDFSISNVSVYPNPTNDILNVSSLNNEINNYSIFDLQGRKVYSNKVNNLNNFSLDITNLNSGIYIIELYSENGKYSQKIVKK